MTKAEIIKMLENIADNEEVIFVEDTRDWDGFHCDRANKNIYRIVKATAELKKVKEYGIYTERFE